MRLRKKKAELEKIQKEFDQITADYHGEDIWDLRQFLMLLNLAENEKMGKSKAIIYAYKIGRLEEKEKLLYGIEEYLAGGECRDEKQRNGRA